MVLNWVQKYVTIWAILTGLATSAVANDTTNHAGLLSWWAVKWKTSAEIVAEKAYKDREDDSKKRNENPFDKEVEVYNYETGWKKLINPREFFSTHTKSPE